METAFLICAILFLLIKASEVALMYLSRPHKPVDELERKMSVPDRESAIPPQIGTESLTEDERRKQEERQRLWDEGIDNLMNYSIGGRKNGK